MPAETAPAGLPKMRKKQSFGKRMIVEPLKNRVNSFRKKKPVAEPESEKPPHPPTPDTVSEPDSDLAAPTVSGELSVGPVFTEPHPVEVVATQADEPSADWGNGEDKRTDTEEAIDAIVPVSLQSLLEAVADTAQTFGCVDEPERALRTPAIKAYEVAGGGEYLDNARPLPEGFYLLQVGALAKPSPD